MHTLCVRICVWHSSVLVLLAYSQTKFTEKKKKQKNPNWIDWPNLISRTIFFHIEFQDNDKNVSESDNASADVVDTATNNDSGDTNENQTENETNESEQNATDVVVESSQPIDNA